MRTLTVGHITHDRYEEGFVAGGCAFYGAKVHAKLSGDTHLATVVGEDFTCDDEVAGLDTTLHRRGETTVFANYYPPGKPRIQLLEAQAPDVTPKMAPSDWLGADLIHLAPVMGEVDLVAWKEAAGGSLVAINVQGWIKIAGSEVDAAELERDQRRGVEGSARRVVQRPWEVTEDALAGVDVACLSEEDLIDQGDLLERLLRAVPVVALTLGRRGSRIYVDGEPTEVGIYATDAVDPTGAGDVFAAAFAHQLAAGDNPVDAARFAAACSSIVVEDVGARALRRLDEAHGRATDVPARG